LGKWEERTIEEGSSTMKIVINADVGGFSLSDKAIERLLELGYSKEETEKDKIREECKHMGRKYSGLRGIPRDHPLLVKVVEELGSEANGDYATLCIVEVPDDVEWTIEEYDGSEWVAERA
jgi:hypothetical protein